MIQLSWYESEKNGETDLNHRPYSGRPAPAVNENIAKQADALITAKKNSYFKSVKAFK